MSQADAQIAKLDDTLAVKGQDVTLVRPSGTQRTPFSVVCRAFVRGYTPEEVAASSGILQGMSRVVMSPTQINAKKWPGGAKSKTGGDKRIPKQGDEIIINGTRRAVHSATGIYPNGTLVRIEISVKG